MPPSATGSAGNGLKEAVPAGGRGGYLGRCWAVREVAPEEVSWTAGRVLDGFESVFRAVRLVVRYSWSASP